MMPIFQVIKFFVTKPWLLTPLGWPILACHAYRNRDQILAVSRRAIGIAKSQPVILTLERDDREGVLPPPGPARTRGH